jgi:hypothetical protein
MNGKVKFRVGDIVYHKNLNLGRGRVRYIYPSTVQSCWLRSKTRGQRGIPKKSSAKASLNHPNQWNPDSSFAPLNPYC